VGLVFLLSCSCSELDSGLGSGKSVVLASSIRGEKWLLVERGKHTFCVEEDSGDDSDGSSGIVEVCLLGGLSEAHDLDWPGLFIWGSEGSLLCGMLFNFVFNSLSCCC
jgi:hypothetical protein